MNEPLVPDVSHLKIAASFAACLAIGGVTVYAALPAPSPETIVHHDRVPVAVAMPVPVTIQAAPSLAPSRSLDLHFVMQVGSSSFIKLAAVGGDGEAMPAHGKAHLVETEGASATAVASVDTEAVPLAYRGWLGKKVVVDGTCTTEVTGFAVVARLIGDPAYAGEQGDKWNVDTAMKNGEPVLAAKLAGCSGTYARDAALPAVIVPVAIHDESLASEARAALIASDVGATAQQQWRDSWQLDNHWADVVPFDTQIVRHPVTGVTWVLVHAHGEEACGNPNVNLIGLYRVSPDGKLVPVSVREASYESIQMIDVDGDGKPELLGAPWLGVEHELQSAGGTVIETLSLPFYGCPC